MSIQDEYRCITRAYLTCVYGGREGEVNYFFICAHVILIGIEFELKNIFKTKMFK